MAIQELTDGTSASVFRGILNANYNELESNKAGVDHASATTAYGAASGSMYGHVKVTQGNGLNIANGVVSMGTASTSAAGAVQLVDNYTTTDATKAATANALKSGLDSTVKTYWGSNVPSASLGKVGDIYVKV